MGTRKPSKLRISSAMQGIGRPMKDGENYPYAIICHNIRTLEKSVEVAVVMGQTRAAQAVQYHNSKLTTEQRDAGWSHFGTRTTKRPWNEILESRSNNKPGILRK
jgi:CO dehydrogenase/acetyl-CoA synthase beta subunit